MQAAEFIRRTSSARKIGDGYNRQSKKSLKVGHITYELQIVDLFAKYLLSDLILKEVSLLPPFLLLNPPHVFDIKAFKAELNIIMKHIYIIIYNTYNNNYEAYYRVINRIKDLTGDWQHPVNDVWFIKSEGERDIKEMLKTLYEVADKRDRLFITEIGQKNGEDYVGYMPPVMWRWLCDKNR